ncbi:MAG TPA: bifunctional 5,10-methylene-tetrahydrofolate dehydrogenase/5,10-methylene-tetrahydrofolate cyclohydrolase, partial [Dehalococcoidia bacterium]|nr:bifunctional 5,10-methylene-tetrahydrofolate dehydrogenase/5,10-methylene-tetrahydrofolate cyclohydrolase [Dehalococcoidia bacterium]
MSAKVMNGTEMAKEIRAEAAEGVAEMRDKHGIVPGLAVVLVGDDPASKVYVRNKDRAATEAGMVSESIVLPDSTTQDEVLSVVRRLNGDARIHAILVQLPLPDHIDEDAVIESINPDKDVDGLHPFNMGLLMAGLPRFIP